MCGAWHVHRVVARPYLQVRVTLKVDSSGTIISAEDAPATLFGARPSVLVGLSLDQVIEELYGWGSSPAPPMQVCSLL